MPSGKRATPIRSSTPTSRNRVEFAAVGIALMTVRLRRDFAADLEAVARADGNSRNAEMLEAIDDYIATRLADPQFQARLAAEDRVILEGGACETPPLKR